MRTLIVWTLSLLLLLTLFFWLILCHGSGHIIPIKTDIFFLVTVIMISSILIFLKLRKKDK
jgi:hypothetical protein